MKKKKSHRKIAAIVVARSRWFLFRFYLAIHDRNRLMVRVMLHRAVTRALFLHAPSDGDRFIPVRK